jgi:hypothetical protein
MKVLEPQPDTNDTVTRSGFGEIFWKKTSSYGRVATAPNSEQAVLLMIPDLKRR